MRKTIALLAGPRRSPSRHCRRRRATPAAWRQASPCGKGHNKPGAPCGKTIHRGADAGYEVIFDGSRRCFERWRYAGGRRSRCNVTGR